MTIEQLKNVIESLLMASQEPLSINRLLALFKESEEEIGLGDIKKVIESLKEDYEARGIELIEVASGFRIQVRPQYARWLHKLTPEKPERYSQALLETLALIIYRQPITRGEIEQIRGVSVSTQIMRTLQERNWVRVLGHKNVPGKPALYGTTAHFLNDFNVANLSDLPKLKEFEEGELKLEQGELDSAIIGEINEQTRENNHEQKNEQAEYVAQNDFETETAREDKNSGETARLKIESTEAEAEKPSRCLEEREGQGAVFGEEDAELRDINHENLAKKQASSLENTETGPERFQKSGELETCD